MVSLGYFPDRYKLHILVPLAVNISAGISLFQASGSVAASSARNEPHPARGLVHLVLLSLPTGVLWAPLLVAGVGTTAVDAVSRRSATRSSLRTRTSHPCMRPAPAR